MMAGSDFIKTSTGTNIIIHNQLGVSTKMCIKVAPYLHKKSTTRA